VGEHNACLSSGKICPGAHLGAEHAHTFAIGTYHSNARCLGLRCGGRSRKADEKWHQKFSHDLLDLPMKG
jgi:hypothetical protein